MGVKEAYKHDYNAIEDDKKVSKVGIRHLQILLMLLAASVLFVVRSGMGVAVLAMTDEKERNNTNNVTIYDWSEQVKGVVKSSFFWGYMVMQIPGGVMAKHFGGKPLVLSALLLNGLLCLLLPMMTKYGSWYAVCFARVMMGLSQACLFPSFHSLVGKWIPPDERTTLSAIAYSGSLFGTIITMPLCGILAKTALGWKMIFYCTGALSCAMGIIWAYFSASSPVQHRFIRSDELYYIEKSLNTGFNQKSPPVPWRHIFTSRYMWAIIFAHVGSNWAFLVVFIEAPNYLKNCFGMDVKESGIYSCLPFISMFLGQNISGFFCQYVQNKNLMSVTTSRKLFNSIGTVCYSFGLVILMLLSSDQRITAIIVLTISAGLFSCSLCGFQFNHIDLSPTFGGIMYGLSNCFANMIGSLQPVVNGIILGDKPTDMRSWRFVFIITVGIVMLCNTVYVALGSCDRQPWDNPTPKVEELKELNSIKNEKKDALLEDKSLEKEKIPLE